MAATVTSTRAQESDRMCDAGETNGENRIAAVEALLFVSDGPLTEPELARALLCSPEEVAEALEALTKRLDYCSSGLQVIRIAGGYQLCTRPVHAEAIARLLARESGKLSRAALETLAVIAYRQPITQPEIESIRGVACTSVIKTLLERNLISEQGRKPTPGRPILYGTTPSFLHYFGLQSLSELPPLEPIPAIDAEEGG